MRRGCKAAGQAMRQGVKPRIPVRHHMNNSPLVMVLPPIARHTARSRALLREVKRAADLRLSERRIGEISVLSSCKLYLAFGRTLKTTNPAALASFAAGTTGAGLGGAVFIADWLNLRHRTSLTHGWPRCA
ncbi:hypothetical protein BN2475_100123 [Paraburkholderia ribeironis]|uniref:Uncharacterized protein n=1 Tax=Paraburkholderia ribeironis TaxID=1247936 RepID=A0A1N7RQX8_9BURK|nr:hypothetical protein BN2475_100123 [Paraburkholderia ribeironis]